MNTFPATLKKVQEANEDFEWYPTTNSILNKLSNHIEARKLNSWSKFDSILDIGAGNGKVLNYLKEKGFFNEYFAIEKSQVLLSNLDDFVNILGVDFLKCSLLDKDVTNIFCNPPYKQYEEWACKILEESPEGVNIYLVIPERWKNSRQISDLIKSRDIKEEIIDSFSFEDSEDRIARAKVDLIYFKIKNNGTRKSAFCQFFDKTFQYPEPKKEEKLEEKIENTQLTTGKNLIETLCFIYEERMVQLQENYKAVCSLDPNLLKEFEITKQGLMSSLEMKLKTLKKEYWKRLFDGTGQITERLTSKSRKEFVNKINSHTGLDFNAENAYAIIIWAIKNANSYFDKQLVDVYEQLVYAANVENYVSNKRVFNEREFRYDYYNEKPSAATHFKLKIGHRIVAENSGGLYKSSWSYENGLTERAADLICDLLTVANNMGFTPISKGPLPRAWDDNGAREYFCKYKGETVSLFTVRCFYNSNMHFQFFPEFIHALNIQHGRIKGWVNRGNAAQELGLKKEDIEQFFDGFSLTREKLMLT